REGHREDDRSASAREPDQHLASDRDEGEEGLDDRPRARGRERAQAGARRHWAEPRRRGRGVEESRVPGRAAVAYALGPVPEGAEAGAGREQEGEGRLARRSLLRA